LGLFYKRDLCVWVYIYMYVIYIYMEFVGYTLFISYVWKGSFICMAWLILFVWRILFKRHVSVEIYVKETCNGDTFMYVMMTMSFFQWLVYECVMTHSCMCDMTLRHARIWFSCKIQNSFLGLFCKTDIFFCMQFLRLIDSWQM